MTQTSHTGMKDDVLPTGQPNDADATQEDAHIERAPETVLSLSDSGEAVAAHADQPVAESPASPSSFFQAGAPTHGVASRTSGHLRRNLPLMRLIQARTAQLAVLEAHNAHMAAQIAYYRAKAESAGRD
ncbi:hypothetical protein CYLTODRAFT_492820 [Cylindrobasidium torrendii FP15055 ss-10]|uniref:Uncharacterized protein n=1 Tax=Cylindrobasidium torrendii FP15055 ss-10 TaxID=1314674 RepID=A0A0D7B3P4_9AGAR|nr:hypothetical protein CYLTODRAFT_492820 [Cylindrobasidium torrendii FP15055 ss-10]